jgi:hypothetical protein
MAHSGFQTRARRPTSQASVRPLRTAIGGLSVGSLLLAAVALMHDDAPVARLVAERVAEANKHRAMLRPTAQPLVAGVSRAEHSTRAPLAGRQSTAPAAQASAHFWNAAQVSPNAEHGPTIQLDPPVVSRDPTHIDATHADTSRVPFNEPASDSTRLMTRTYRPVLMSAVSLERLVRPLLTARGQMVASNSGVSAVNTPVPAVTPSPPTAAADATPPGVLVVSDRPEAIGRIDALCRDLESMSPRIAIDLVVVNVVPTAGEQLPWEQWRNSFGTVESDLPAVLKQIRSLGRATVCTRSQLQGLGGTWTELSWSEQSVAGSPRIDAAAPDEEDREPPTPPVSNTAGATALTTLHVRPSIQPDGAIRLEVRAQSGRIENRGQSQRPQLVSVRFNTEVVLHEGATGVVNLFVDEPGTSAASVPSATATLVIPGGSALPAAKIVPQPGQREQTLLLLMPRIVRPARPGKIAISQPRDPA